MGDGMMQTANALGGVAAGWQGNIYVRIPTKEDPEKFWIVSLYFSSLTDLAELMTNIKAKGWQPFTDVINLKVGELSLPDKQEAGPDECPIHGTKLKPSRRPGFLFCPSKNADGSFCVFNRRV